MEEQVYSLVGKNIIITGANSGIGKETAVSLAEMGANVIMMCRNKTRGENALEEIKQRSGSNQVALIIMDLSDPISIYSAVSQYKEKYNSLDVLINNAGLFLRKRTMEKTGFETTFAVNHLGHFLLTSLLLDLLIKSAPSRIINVSSEAHRYSKFNLRDINMEKKYYSFRAYSNSKLANILFTYKLSRKLKGTGVTVNTLHPGFVKTNFGKKQYSRFLTPLMKLVNLFAINAKKGAKTSIFLASSPEVKNLSGKYFVKSKEVKSSKQSYYIETQERLWQLSEEFLKLTGFNIPEVEVYKV